MRFAGEFPFRAKQGTGLMEWSGWAAGSRGCRVKARLEGEWHAPPPGALSLLSGGGGSGMPGASIPPTPPVCASSLEKGSHWACDTYFVASESRP